MCLIAKTHHVMSPGKAHFRDSEHKSVCCQQEVWGTHPGYLHGELFPIGTASFAPHFATAGLHWAQICAFRFLCGPAAG